MRNSMGTYILLVQSPLPQYIVCPVPAADIYCGQEVFWNRIGAKNFAEIKVFSCLFAGTGLK